MSSFRGRAVQRKRPTTLTGVWGVFVSAVLSTRPTTRRPQACCPQSRQQGGFEAEDPGQVSVLAIAKRKSCCRCERRRPDIHYRDRPLPDNRPLARSLCDHTTRSRLADGEAGRTPWLRSYGGRIHDTSCLRPFRFSDHQFDGRKRVGVCLR